MPAYIINALHLITLYCFAFAQPVYNLLGTYPEFLIAHESNALEISVLFLLLGIGIPVLIMVGSLILALTFKSHFVWVQGSAVGFLSILAALQVQKLTIDSNSFLVLPIVLAVGFVCGILYVRKQVVRLFVTFLSPAIVIFPMIVLFSPAVHSLLFKDSIPPLALIVEKPAPIVMVIMDELPLVSLLDKEGMIDEVRFPAFAELASGSTWYRNTTTTGESTLQALPAIMTGKYPDLEKVPHAIDYPENIFRYLGHHHFHSSWL